MKEIKSHAELVSASQPCFPRPWRERMPGGQVRGYSLGFTLIEILMVVLIIGILGAIALPQYQRAVLRSRFAALMPIAKSLADSNEVYFLDHGEYADNPADLLVAGRDKNAGAYPDGTKIVMYSDEADLSFVRSENDNIPTARYVVYQKHSKNFPDTTWCEAKDTHAEEMCQALGGQFVEGGSSSGSSTDANADNNWKAYLLSGTAREGDSFAEAGSGGSGTGTSSTNTPVVLDEATLAKLQEIVDNCSSYYTCFINEAKGTVTKCSNSSGQVLPSGECVPTVSGSFYKYEYNADGKEVAGYACNAMTDDTCTQYQARYKKYNSDKSYTLTQRVCNGGVIPASPSGTCSNGQYTEASYGSSGNQDQTLDSHGRYTTRNICIASSIGTDGTCGAYSEMSKYDQTYDENGNHLNTVTHTCTSIKPNSTTCLEWS